ncbi:MAG: TetR/AcrR family transcriptional regulator [Myxococcales bacterium]|nr:TetR/AcrR family transcriptional regulator [Myxococcales bacterium]
MPVPDPTALRTPSQSRAVRTREGLLLAGAIEFSRSGYATTTSKSIATRAGVATGSFYQYFADKDALLRELAAARLSQLAKDAFGSLSASAPRVAVPRAAALRSVRLAVLPAARARREVVEQLMGHVVDVVLAAHRDDPGLHAVLTERRHADPQLDELTSHAERALVTQIAGLLAELGQRDALEGTAFVLFGMVEGSVHAHVLGRPILTDACLRETLIRVLVRIVLSDRERPELAVIKRKGAPRHEKTAGGATTLKRSKAAKNPMTLKQPRAGKNAKPLKQPKERK